MSYTRPQFLKLTPQERRVFDALRHDWCNTETVSRKAAPPGHLSSCEPKVLICKVKRLVAEHGWTVETRPLRRAPGSRGKPPMEYRIVREQVRAAA